MPAPAPSPQPGGSFIRALCLGTVVATLLAPAPLAAQNAASTVLQVLPDAHAVSVFGDGPRPISLRLSNPTSDTIEAELGFQLVQLSSSTAAPLSTTTSWKRLRVLPGQVILESATIRFPEVRGATRFLVRWDAAGGRSPGTTAVTVYPQDLLSELPRLAKGPIGVLDPGNQLRPLLLALKLEVTDLELHTLENFDGPLAILGPFTSANQMPSNLSSTVRHRAEAGRATVWILPPAFENERPPVEPRSYLFETGRGAVFVAGSDAVAGLRDNPQAQLNLVRFARLALQTDRLDLPRIKL